MKNVPAQIYAGPGLYLGLGQAHTWAQPNMGPNMFGTRTFFRNNILKTLILYILLNADFGVFLQKKRAPKNDECWSDVRAEISHMRPIQG